MPIVHIMVKEGQFCQVVERDTNDDNSFSVVVARWSSMLGHVDNVAVVGESQEDWRARVFAAYPSLEHGEGPQ